MNKPKVSLREKAAKGIVWSVIQKWGREGISSIALIVLSRLLVPEAFGLVALASVFTAFASVFLDQGFGAAIVQRKELEPEHLDTAFWITIASGLIMTSIGVAGSGLIAGLFKEPDLAPVIRWLSLSFVISALSSTQIAILQRKLAFKALAARSLAAAMMGGVVGVSLAFAGFGVWSLVAQDLASGVAGVFVLWRASEWRPGLNLSRKHYKELFTFGISVIGNNTLKVLMRRSDDLLIGYFLGPVLLGYYTIGYQLLLFITRLVTEITDAVAFPAFSRLQHNPARLRNAFYRVTQYTSLLAFPVFIGLASVAQELVPVVFGAKWAPSIPVMQVLAFIGILQSVMFFNNSILRAAGRPSWEFGIMLLTSASSVIGFLVAVRWGIVAVAASFVFVGYLLSPVSYAAVKRLVRIEIKTYLRQFIAPLLSSLVMVAVVLALKFLLKPQDLNSYVELAIYVLAGGLTYLIFILLTARQVSYEVLDLANLVLPKGKFRKVSGNG